MLCCGELRQHSGSLSFHNFKVKGLNPVGKIAFDFFKNLIKFWFLGDAKNAVKIECDSSMNFFKKSSVMLREPCPGSTVVVSHSTIIRSRDWF